MSRRGDMVNRGGRSVARAAQILATVQAAPASLGNPGRSITAVAAGVVGFAIGNYVKCVAGTWSKLIDSDAGPLVVGVVVAVDGQQALVQLWGIRAAAGTAGTIYYAGTTAGSSTTAAPTATEGVTPTTGARIVEVQIDAKTRLVRPEIFATRATVVTTCEADVETLRSFIETV